MDGSSRWRSGASKVPATSGRVEHELEAQAHEPNDRRDAIARDHRMIRQATEDLDELTPQANLLLGFAERRRNRIRIPGLDTASGKRDLPGVVFEVIGAQRQEDCEVVTTVDDRNEYRSARRRRGDERFEPRADRHRRSDRSAAPRRSRARRRAGVAARRAIRATGRRCSSSGAAAFTGPAFLRVRGAPDRGCEPAHHAEVRSLRPRCRESAATPEAARFAMAAARS